MRYKANTEEEQYGYQQYLAQEQVKMDVSSMKWLLDNREGRWFLLRLFRACQLTGTTFTGNSMTFYNEGRRAVVVSLHDLILEHLGADGVKLLLQAELVMIDFEDRCRKAAEEKEDEDYDD